MPFFMVRNLDGDWDGTQLINARDEEHAAQLWREQRDVERDHPLAVAREQMQYPEDEYADEDEAG